MVIEQVQYGTAFASTAGYLVNEGSNAAVGATEIDVDSGSGGIPKGSVLRFAGHGGVYIVEEGITGASGTLTLASGLRAQVNNNAAVSILALTTVTDFLEEGFEPGDEEAQRFAYGDGAQGQDGVSLEGTIYMLGTNIPSAGTRTWLVYKYGSTYSLVGGDLGCRISRARSNVRQHGAGPAYEAIMYSCTASQGGGCITHTA